MPRRRSTTLDGGLRTATVAATTDIEVPVLNGLGFETLVRSSSEAAHRALKTTAIGSAMRMPPLRLGRPRVRVRRRDEAVATELGGS